MMVLLGRTDGVGDDRIRSVILWRVAEDLNTLAIGHKHSFLIKFIRLPIPLPPSLAKRDPAQRQARSRLKQRRHGAAHHHPHWHFLGHVYSLAGRDLRL